VCRYVLEGSVRKAANRLRITGQLIDATTGTHLWADRFDGQLDNVFDLQDEVAAAVVGIIAPTLEKAEIERAQRKPTENLDAYDHYLRGMVNLHQMTGDEALRLFHRAIELDPSFAPAYTWAARCFVKSQGSRSGNRPHARERRSGKAGSTGCGTKQGRRRCARICRLCARLCGW
jgi:adenylate cyclase